MAQNGHATSQNGYVPEFSAEEARELFDGRARYHLGISGRRFVARWKNGFYADRTEDPHVISVAMLLPLIGEDPRQKPN